MPFEPFASYFGHAELKALREAYTATLDDLSAEVLALPPDKLPLFKQKLAQLILASACNRKRNADELKEIALRGLRTSVCRPTLDLKAARVAIKQGEPAALNRRCD